MGVTGATGVMTNLQLVDNLEMCSLELADLDGDGYFDPAHGGDDCDDTDPTVHPGASELCDGVDTNCDGVIWLDEVDADGEGFMICDGECDDGGPGSDYDACDYGTDCTDCGHVHSAHQFGYLLSHLVTQ